MKPVDLWIVESDPRTGDGGGRWLAACPHRDDAADIALMLDGVLRVEPARAVESEDGKIEFIGTAGCPIYKGSWDYAKAQMPPRVAAFVERMTTRFARRVGCGS